MPQPEQPHTILLVHCHYRLPGGEDAVFAAECAMLQAHGHRVITYERNNDAGGLAQKLLLPLRAIYSTKTVREVRALIRKEQVDLVHVHNTLLTISPSVFQACFKEHVPAVQTLHNFRIFCPNGILMRDGHVCGVVTALGGYYSCKCVVIATGTALGGRIFVGEAHYDGGPDGTHAATALTKDLTAHGVPLRRFKTGTPARVHRRSIDFSKLDCQPGDPDELLQPFSFMTHKPMHNKVDCYIAYTNPETHKVILDNLSRSPLYGGDIQGVGPRYCPSIEDKVVRFKGKERHPVFVEPCGEDTEEMYLQGMSSSLPEAVQNAMYRTIKGFENLEIMRPAYAIEYDCVDPTSMLPTLESKVIGGMYGAGQFNGTSGYEEAAAQGLLAGLNAARQALGKSELVLARHTSYLGTLVDDLVTKGVMDPYRMMTSRSEYRLSLRQDNADERLTPIGREYGLVDDTRWAAFTHDMEVKKAELHRLETTKVPLAELRTVAPPEVLETLGESGGTAAELLKRPGVHYELLAKVIGRGQDVSAAMALRIETEIRYAGYIAREQRAIHEVQRHENVVIPDDFDYAPLETVTLEAREKLAKIRPRTLAQAGRIPGVSPSDLAQLSIALMKAGKTAAE